MPLTDNVAWTAQTKGQYLGYAVCDSTVKGVPVKHCKYIIEANDDDADCLRTMEVWGLFLNRSMGPELLAYGRISFLMRMAEIHHIEGR